MNGDGGPAFPVAWPLPDDPEPGMSLRDWFAGLAMQGMLANPDRWRTIRAEEQWQRVSAASYSLADEMLIRRDGNPDDKAHHDP